jgi:S-adenosylmethionine:diacylglycerol 3-amino-3-carboxypropyl transferase
LIAQAHRKFPAISDHRNYFAWQAFAAAMTPKIAVVPAYLQEET